MSFSRFHSSTSNALSPDTRVRSSNSSLSKDKEFSDHPIFPTSEYLSPLTSNQDPVPLTPSVPPTPQNPLLSSPTSPQDRPVSTTGTEVLGNLTKSASTVCSTQISKGTGKEESVPLTAYEQERTEVARHAEIRRTRWQLRDIAADVVGGRVCHCGKKVVPHKEVVVRRKDGKTYYSNLRACGSVWICPVCSAKISKLRADELRKGIETWLSQGNTLTMLTLTVRHERSDDLQDLQERMAKAQRWFYSGRWYQTLKEKHNIAGSVRNLECTWGYQSGWHPHSHVLLFSQTDLDPQTLYDRWQQACSKYNLYASWEAFHEGVSTANQAAADYLLNLEKSSWSAAEELTFAHYKTAKDRFTPYDLLRQVKETGEAIFADKFEEFAKAYKGKRQLYWSKGLRDLLKLGQDQTDEALANKEDESNEIILSIPRPIWRYILRANLRLEILEWLETYGVAYVEDFLSVALLEGVRAQGP